VPDRRRLLSLFPAVAPVYALMVDAKLRTFPSKDREFAAFARAAWEGLEGPRTQETLQHAMRVRYPVAVVTAQNELARHGEGPPVWYVFRTATLGVAPIDDEPAEDAWAVIDDDRRFVEVSPALARIAELPARRMVGHRIEDFSNPSDPTIREDIERLWREFVRRRAIATTLRFNFADGRPRELGYRLVADADGEGRHRLTVKVLAPASTAGESLNEEKADEPESTATDA
jgi:PAS domain-containing protein